jgi:hypothetical protein
MHARMAGWLAGSKVPSRKKPRHIFVGSLTVACTNSTTLDVDVALAVKGEASCWPRRTIWL